MRQTMRYTAMLIVIALWAAVTPSYSQATPQKPPVKPGSLTLDLHAYTAIYVAPLDSDVAYRMARVLQAEFAALYDVHLDIFKTLPQKQHRAILIGRAIVDQLGLIEASAFDAVKWDGYLIQARPHQVIIAGYAPPGTIYGVYAFLKQLGLSHYPWHFGGVMKRYTPLPKAQLAEFSVADKPFFELRDVLGQYDRGRFGSTMRQYTLGELKWARTQPLFKGGGYMGWDHTAGYLVPIQAHLGTHPEFYPMKHGTRIPPTTPTMQVGLCACHPEIEAISIQNALAWMQRQPTRRLFAITDGDQAGWRCPSCAQSDPAPHYYTDRNLRWVNAVARAIRQPYPDNRVLTLAYLDTVKPPLEAGLEPNALVFYAPWHWTSRATSSVGFDHPLNVTAMEEFIAWTRLFPGQIGVYDYTGPWVYGAAERIKLYAKHDVRWVYMNRARGNLLHWVASQLLWDPSLDVEALIAEFIHAFYGPAADVMQRYYRLRRDTMQRHTLTTFISTAVLQDSAFLEPARGLLRLAHQRLRDADIRTRMRGLEGLTDQLYWVLHAEIGMQAEVEPLRHDFELYLNWHEALWDDCDQLSCTPHQWAMRTRQFERRLQHLGLPQVVITSPAKADRTWALEQVKRYVEPYLQSLRRSTSSPETKKPARIVLSFTQPDEMKRWQAWSSEAHLTPTLTVKSIMGLHGEALVGVGATLALSQLPKTQRGRHAPTKGRFRLQRRFEPPLNGRHQRYISLHLHVSQPAPVTLFINENPALRSDLNLSAGEQIVRIDLNHFSRPHQPLADGLNIESITLDVWPQNRFYPYPETRDTDLLLSRLTLETTTPSPQVLPHRGQVIWMSHFRPNLRHRTGGQPQADGLRDMPRSQPERFRSSTPHRILSPIAAIVTEPSHDPVQAQAVTRLQRRLHHAYGVTLPVLRRSRRQPRLDNAWFLGPVAALAADRISFNDLDDISQGGFVIRARHGAIAIAGQTWADTQQGLSRYLHLHGIGAQTKHAKKSPFLHELYLIDKSTHPTSLQDRPSQETHRSREGIRAVQRHGSG